MEFVKKASNNAMMDAVVISYMIYGLKCIKASEFTIAKFEFGNPDGHTCMTPETPIFD
jgi:hypothetical protein